MKNNKNKISKTKREEKLRRLPFWLFIIFMFLLVAGTIVLTGFIIKEITVCSETSLYIQLLLGLAATILSIIIAINGIATMIVNNINKEKELERQKTETISKFIEMFNKNYLSKIDSMNRIVNRICKKGLVIKFNVSLSKQVEEIEEFNTQMQNANIDFKSECLYACAVEGYTRTAQFSDDIVDFCERVIKDRKASKPINKKVTTIGGVAVRRFYRSERIAILNFFEDLAISYFNDKLNREMVNAQFKPMLDKIIPSFYYFIYTDEGIDCYPYLNMMLDYMHER